ncbi:MAG: hypothetical protein FJX52_10430, partial [Alphaproteobacteria bacterium]|nr:hypothetical protein [Alphaproteobacteria bacterium]
MRDEELQRVYHFFDDPSATADLDRLEELAPHCFFHLVDTSNANPAGYRLARYDRRATLDAGRNYTGLQFGDYPVRVYRDNLQQQLCATWSLRTPRYSGVQWSREGGEM